MSARVSTRILPFRHPKVFFALGPAVEICVDKANSDDPRLYAVYAAYPCSIEYVKIEARLSCLSI